MSNLSQSHGLSSWHLKLLPLLIILDQVFTALHAWMRNLRKALSHNNLQMKHCLLEWNMLHVQLPHIWDMCHGGMVIYQFHTSHIIAMTSRKPMRSITSLRRAQRLWDISRSLLSITTAFRVWAQSHAQAHCRMPSQASSSPAIAEVMKCHSHNVTRYHLNNR